MTLSRSLLLLPLLAFAACTARISATPVPAKPYVTQQRAEAALAQAAAQPITCASTQDCAEKWQRALAWVKRNSSYPITQNTDSVIATSGPLINTATDSAFTITRQGNQITFASQCGTATAGVTFGGAPLGCVPSVLELKANFTRYVMQGY